MADNASKNASKKRDSKRRPEASLTDLLAEHTRVAEQERQEIESKLREKEEEERRRREEEERQQKAVLQQRLEEEKRRAQERFQRQQDKDERSVAGAGPVAAVVATASVAAASPAKGHALLAVAATIVLMAGAAAGAWFLFLNDPTPELSVMKRQGTAVVAAAGRQADVLLASWAATQQAEAQGGAVEALQKKLTVAESDIQRLEAKMTEAQKAAAAAEKAAAATREAAAEEGAAATNGKRKPRTGARTGDSGGAGIRVRSGVFSGKEIVE